mmetsp:Transcript_76678/g.197480  ORF Transcript_76678/g.197480 Transcript_76678/m.197480 type:complete len:322 (+) Transcript_76678:477-1442(+)
MPCQHGAHPVGGVRRWAKLRRQHHGPHQVLLPPARGHELYNRTAGGAQAAVGRRQLPRAVAARAAAVPLPLLATLREAVLQDQRRLLQVVARGPQRHPALHRREGHGRRRRRRQVGDRVADCVGELGADVPCVGALTLLVPADALYPEAVQVGNAGHQHSMRAGGFRTVKRQVLQQGHIGRGRCARGEERKRQAARRQHRVRVPVMQIGVHQRQLQQELGEVGKDAGAALRKEPGAQRLQEVERRRRANTEAQFLEHRELRGEHLVERDLVPAEVGYDLPHRQLRVLRARLQCHADCREQLALQGAATADVLARLRGVVAV